jgi:4-hydroxybenzoate polyprenyltransferase
VASRPHPGHPVGGLGIIHPFPTLLVSGLAGALASLAGGTPWIAVALALAMLGFQASIGACNDLVDLPHDRANGSRKPLPAGQLTVPVAWAVVVGGGIVGLALSATMGAVVLGVGLAGYLCGIGYDLWLRTRGLDWLAFATAIPLLLAYPWLGATGHLPPAWPVLLPLAALVGPALHLSNSLIDVDTDGTHEAGGAAARLGRHRALVLLALLVLMVHALAWVVVASAAGAPAPMLGMPMLGMLAAAVLAALGVALSASRERARRTEGWTIQALATALLAVAWAASIRA